MRYLLCLFVPAIAAAQPAAGAQAESLFNTGRKLMQDRKYTEACASFEASEKLEPATTTIVNLADCREKNGQLASAWGLYLQAERELRGLNDESAAKLRETMRARAASLEPKLSKLTIRVADDRSPGLEVIRDNDRVESGAWNQALPIDGGSYKVSARAPGRREWTTTVSVQPVADSQVVVVPTLGAPDPTPIAAPAVVTLPQSQERDDEPPVQKPSYIPAIAVGGGAVVLGVTAILLEVSARSTYSDAQAAIDVNQQADLWHSANNKRYAAEGVGIAALGCAAVAVWLYVREHRDTPTVTAMPIVTPTSGGIAFVGGF